MEKKHAFELTYLKSLVEFMKDNDLDEIKVSEGESTIRLRRNLQPKGMTHMMPVAAPMFQGMEGMPASAPAAAPAAPAAEDTMSGHTLKSPMVGTFYRSPSPEAESFVNVGDAVKKGQTVCIIEAMKTMNQIEADKDGVIKKIMPDDAQPVEFGQPLFIIE